MKKKNIIITGANGNLGTAVVKKFLYEGYHVIATVLHQAAIETLDSHAELEVRLVDLSKEAEVTFFIEETLEKHEVIDAALMLAGGFSMGNIEKTSASDLMKMYSLNFETAYNIIRPLFPHMIEKGYGRLVVVGARPALDPDAGKNMIAYALSKSLLIKLAEYLNAASKGKNVTTTVIIPSTIDTPENRKSMPAANFENWVKASQIADLMEVICSEKGSPVREGMIKVYGNL